MALDVLAEHTAFGHALLEAVCSRRGKSVADLSAADVLDLVGDLALQVAVFNGPDEGFAVKRALLLALNPSRGF